MQNFVSLLILATANAKAMVGTNIGGWLVLEPWITPSLFYRFLDKTHSEGVGIDSYTVCEALGPVEGNKLMRAHWDSWVTDDQIKGLADREVEIIRVPIGDWTTTSYGPYIGCMDGAAEKIQWLLDTASKYNIKVLLDVHAIKDSQNGFDNSGQASNLEWIDETHFKHWSIQAANWMGHWNGQAYDSIDYTHIQWAVENCENIMKMWGNHPAMYALQPVNEPWGRSDMNVLQDFYRTVRNMMRQYNPNVIFVFHDAFNPNNPNHVNWNNLFTDDDMENVIMDTHEYLAWDPRHEYIGSYCDRYQITMSNLNSSKYPVWVGEWSLATDDCAMWLGGFNDSNDYMKYQFDCQWVECPETYLPTEVAVDFDRTATQLGPYGEFDRATVRYGKCATDSSWFSDDDVKVLADCIYDAFNANVEGQFIWNFRTELESKYSYVEAYDKGWLNHSINNTFLQ